MKKTGKIEIRVDPAMKYRIVSLAEYLCTDVSKLTIKLYEKELGKRKR